MTVSCESVNRFIWVLLTLFHASQTRRYAAGMDCCCSALYALHRVTFITQRCNATSCRNQPAPNHSCACDQCISPSPSYDPDIHGYLSLSVFDPDGPVFHKVSDPEGESCGSDSSDEDEREKGIEDRQAIG